MNIEKIIHAQQLVDYIKKDINFEVVPSNNCPYHNHIGALFVDIVLQAGVNYKNIVAPRVNKIYYNYPEADTVFKFQQLIHEKELSALISWNNDIKLNRIIRLVEFCIAHQIDSASELKQFLIQDSNNKKIFLSINGIGSKTYDYLLKLMNVDTIAVDRHIYSFLLNAGIEISDYDYIKSVVEFAADFMNISRRSIDYSIWKYMAYTQKTTSAQGELQF